MQMRSFAIQMIASPDVAERTFVPNFLSYGCIFSQSNESDGKDYKKANSCLRKRYWQMICHPWVYQT